jgi:hypothetical protein
MKQELEQIRDHLYWIQTWLEHPCIADISSQAIGEAKTALATLDKMIAEQVKEMTVEQFIEWIYANAEPLRGIYNHGLIQPRKLAYALAKLGTIRIVEKSE